MIKVLKIQNQKSKYGILSYRLLDYNPKRKRKLNNFAEDFAKLSRLNWFLQVRNYDVVFQLKIPIKVDLFLRLSINSFVLSYVGQTCRHLTTRTDQPFGKDKESHIYQYLVSSTECLDKCLVIYRLLFCFRYRHHQASIKNKGIHVYHMAGAHFK